MSGKISMIGGFVAGLLPILTNFTFDGDENSAHMESHGEFHYFIDVDMAEDGTMETILHEVSGDPINNPLTCPMAGMCRMWVEGDFLSYARIGDEDDKLSPQAFEIMEMIEHLLANVRDEIDAAA